MIQETSFADKYSYDAGLSIEIDTESKEIWVGNYANNGFISVYTCLTIAKAKELRDFLVQNLGDS